jgi:alkylated DNA repair dioxygenase AlkB
MLIHYPLIANEVELVDNFIGKIKADQMYRELSNSVDWRQQTLKIYGKQVASPRLTAWYGDEDAIYQYSGIRNVPLDWNNPLLEIRCLLELFTGNKFNSTLLNLYRDGADSMGSHSDNEPELGKFPMIASISLGATRKFILHSKLGLDSVKVDLSHGSLLIMSGKSQQNWKHSVPKTRKLVKPRINLTYRMIKNTSTRIP